MSNSPFRVLALSLSAAAVVTLSACAPLERRSRAESPALTRRAVQADDAPKSKSKPTADSLVKSLIEAHNEERAAADLPPLERNEQLEAAAEAHARDMAENEMMSHEGSDKSEPAERVERAGYHYRETAENVARGQRTVGEVITGWMESPKHKKNILGPYSEIGVARVKSKRGESYWCAVFGRPWPSLTAEKATAELIELLNREREKAKKPLLTVNEDVQAAAQAYADDMAAQDTFSPKSDAGKTPAERIQKRGYPLQRLGAQAAASTGSPEETLRSWLESAQARGTLMSDFRDVGAGYAKTAKGNPYWCIFLTRPAPDQ